MVKKHNIKLNELDRNNRSVSLLRYLTIFTVSNFEELFITEQIRRIVQDGIYDFFYPNNEKQRDVRLISVYVHAKYVEINFQALPIINLRDFINQLYVHSSTYILKKNPQLERLKGLEGKDLWSENIFLGTRRQLVKQQVEEYLNVQKILSPVAKL
ncbi:MAG: transposase [Promethearchaeota archaeon]